MDRLDNLLSNLPAPPPPQYLVDDILTRIEVQRKRKAYRHLVLSSILAISGSWLALPKLLVSLRDITLSNDGLPILLTGYELLLAGLETMFLYITDSLIAFRSGFETSFGITAWVGLAFLSISALLGLSKLLPHNGKSLK